MSSINEKNPYHLVRSIFLYTKPVASFFTGPYSIFVQKQLKTLEGTTVLSLKVSESLVVLVIELQRCCCPVIYLKVTGQCLAYFLSGKMNCSNNSNVYFS